MELQNLTSVAQQCKSSTCVVLLLKLLITCPYKAQEWYVTTLSENHMKRLVNMDALIPHDILPMIIGI